jgi:hypothetical protein
MSVDFSAPPQLQDSRVNELALLQLRAFFYFLTFDLQQRQGRWWRGKLVPVNGTMKCDFGNAIQVAFARAIADWDYRLILTTARGYFRAVIRKHPNADAWAFALEWNDQYRLVGYFGDEKSCVAEAIRLPHLVGRLFHQGDESWVAVRDDVPLLPEHDTLFTMQDHSDA